MFIDCESGKSIITLPSQHASHSLNHLPSGAAGRHDYRKDFRLWHIDAFVKNLGCRQCPELAPRESS